MASDAESWLPRSSIRSSWIASHLVDEISHSSPPINPRLSLIYHMMAVNSSNRGSETGTKLIIDDFTSHASRLVGRGASFEVTQSIVRATDVGLPVNKLVVLKRPRRSDMADDHPGWKSIILEFRALAFSPMHNHDNIMEMLDLVWDNLTPVLVMECATYGTLAMLERHTLREKTRFRLCHDVARALHFLHTALIVHGDVKSENVLIFGHPERRFIAKLGDFGGSLLDIEEDCILQSGTQPWNAPEWQERTKKAMLPKADIYSFGLLFWRTFLGGDPFSFNALFKDLPSEPARRLAKIQNLKERDEILPISLKCLKPQHPSTPFVWNILRDSLLKNPEFRSLDRVLYSFHDLEQVEDAYETTKQAGLVVEAMEANHNKLVHEMKDILSKGNSLRNSLFPKSKLATDDFASLPLSLKMLLTEGLTQALTSPNVDHAACYLQLSLMSMALDKHKSADDSLAFAHLVSAVQHGSDAAELLLYRFSTALKQKIPDTIDVPLIMRRHILRGSHLASQDLKTVDAMLHSQVLTEIRCLYYDAGFKVFNTIEDAESYLCVSNLSRKLSNGFRVNDLLLLEGPSDETKHACHLLHLTAKHGFVESVNYLLDQGASINQREVTGETALLLACKSGHAKVASVLINRGANVTLSNRFGETPLHWLCAFDALDIPEIAAALSEAGADVEAQRSYNDGDHLVAYNLVDGIHGRLPLDIATERNNDIAVTELLKIAERTRPTLERTRHIFRSIYTACRRRDATIVGILLKYFSRTTTKDQMMGFVYHFMRSVVHSGSRPNEVVFGGVDHVQLFATLEVLRSHGGAFTMIDDGVESPLALAVTLGRCTIVDYFLQAEPEFPIDSPCSLDGKTALHLAIESGSLVMFNMLLDRGADINCGWKFWSSLHLCSLARSEDALGIGRRLLKMGMSLHSTTPQYETPLHFAVLHKSFDLAEELLLHGADINATFTHAYPSMDLEEPMTLLGCILLRNTESDIVSLKFLLRHLDPHRADVILVSPSTRGSIFHLASGISPMHPTDGDTLTKMVEMVFEWWNVDIATKLDVLNSLDQLGYSALHIASMNGNVSLVDLLLSAGADPVHPSASGWSPHQIALHQRRSIERAPNTGVIVEQLELFDRVLHLLGGVQPTYEVPQSSTGENVELSLPTIPYIDIPQEGPSFSEPFEDSRRVVISQNDISCVRLLLRYTPLPPQCVPAIMEHSGFSNIQTLTIREQCVTMSWPKSDEPERPYLLSEPIRGCTSAPLEAVVIRMECRHEEGSVHETSQTSSRRFATSVLREGKEITSKFTVNFEEPGGTTQIFQNTWSDVSHPVLSVARNRDQIGLWVMVTSTPGSVNHICSGKILTLTVPYLE